LLMGLKCEFKSLRWARRYQRAPLSRWIEEGW
jgi:hypothetical protein